MLLCLLHAAFGLALAVPAQFARVEFADRTLEVRALDGGLVALDFRRAERNGMPAERRIQFLRPTCGGALEADVRIERGAIVIAWRRAGEVVAPFACGEGERLRVTLQGEAFVVTHAAPRGAGEHPGRIECPAGPGALRLEAAQGAGALTAERKLGRLVHPPGLPD